ncbi:MAG: hypothetical protein Q6370_018630 [Candidatus Sigynarchaeota archaeon]
MDKKELKIFFEDFASRIDKEALMKLCLMGGIEHFFVSQLCILKEGLVSEVSFKSKKGKKNTLNHLDLVRFTPFKFYMSNDKVKADLERSKVADLFEVKNYAHRRKITEYPAPYGSPAKFSIDTGSTVFRILERLERLFDGNDQEDDLDDALRRYVRESFRTRESIRVICLIFNTFYSTDEEELKDVLATGVGKRYTRYKKILRGFSPDGTNFSWVQYLFKKTMEKLIASNKYKTNDKKKVDRRDIEIEFEEWFTVDLLPRERLDTIPSTTFSSIPFYVGANIACWVFKRKTQTTT